MTRTELIDELFSQTVAYRAYGIGISDYRGLIYDPVDVVRVRSSGFQSNSLFFGVPSDRKRWSDDELLDHLRDGGEFWLGKVIRWYGDEVDGIVRVITEVEYLDHWEYRAEYCATEQAQVIKSNPNGFLTMLASLFKL